MKKFIIILIILLIAFSSGCSRLPLENIPVLLYHSIKEEMEENDSLSMVVTASKFENDLKYLKEKGYKPISLDDLARAYEDPKYKLPKKPILITFDDGYRDNYDIAFPILKEYNMKASIFTIVWSVGRDSFVLNDKPIIPHFSWDQGREMVESGLIDLGSHTFDMHSPEGLSYGYETPCGLGLDQIKGESDEDYYARIYEDIKKSKDIMEENLGHQVNYLAYPYGVYNDTVISILEDLGFRLAFVIDSEEASKSRYEIVRISVTNGLNLQDVLDENK